MKNNEVFGMWSWGKGGVFVNPSVPLREAGTVLSCCSYRWRLLVLGKEGIEWPTPCCFAQMPSLSASLSPARAGAFHDVLAGAQRCSSSFICKRDGGNTLTLIYVPNEGLCLPTPFPSCAINVEQEGIGKETRSLRHLLPSCHT